MSPLPTLSRWYERGLGHVDGQIQQSLFGLQCGNVHSGGDFSARQPALVAGPC